MINVYLDKQTGKPKDYDATVSYKDLPKLLQSGLMGKFLRDSLAKRKLPMNSMWEGMTHCEDRWIPLPPEEVQGPWRS